MVMRRYAEHITVAGENAHRPDYGIKPEPWMRDAICSQTDPELFFPHRGGSSREAKSICAGCAVNVECLDYAMRFESGAEGTATSYARVGIYGGLSPNERQRLAKRVA